MLFSPVYTCSEPRRVESYPRQFVSPSSRDLCVLSVSALDRSFSCILSRLQLSTFDLQPSLSSKSLPHNPFADPHPLNLYAATLYKNSWGAGVLGSGVGTRHSSPATALKFFLFALFGTTQNSTRFFSSDCALFTPKHPGWGVAKGDLLGENSNQSLSEGRTELRARPRSLVPHSAHGTASNSARYEYATGTTSKVSSKQSVCPPMMVTAIEARCSEPAPMPIATGSSPAMMESVVIRMGRRRTRFASMIASRTGIPWARSRLV